MEQGDQATEVLELQNFARGKARYSKDLTADAPQLSADLARCSALLGADTPLDALDVVMDRIRNDDSLTFLEGTPLAGKAPGREWADILGMLFNEKGKDETLEVRRKNFVLPERISRAYSIKSVRSSKLRSEVEPDAFRVLLRKLQSVMPTAGPAPLGSTRLTPPAEVRRVIRRLIATHGLNDAEWAKAISSQYFLCLLARRLALTTRFDYQDLLDRFLESFSYRHNDKIALNPSHVLVTPEETERIRKAMAEEDLDDPYYQNSEKTRAADVNVDDLHINYLYGLTLGITAFGESMILSTLRDVALNYLLGRNGEGRQVLDLDGGWRPYRVPWLTARVLITFSHLPPEVVAEAQCEEVLRNALASLLDRVERDLTWRSGVGDWLSKWESTGLCLEALIAHEPLVEDKELTLRIAEHMRDRYTEWGVTPDFGTEETANETLAGVICAAVLLSGEDRLGLVLAPNIRRELIGLIVSALQLIAATPATVRQFCTVPQVAFYATSLLGRGS